MRDGIREKERAERRERREKRRKEKERKSTLLGDKYDSPLRRWLRWMSRSGLSAWSLPVGLAAVLVVKAAVGLGGFSGKFRSWQCVNARGLLKSGLSCLREGLAAHVRRL